MVPKYRHFTGGHMIKNYYTILKVDKKASDAEIKKAFRELALKLHPDKNKEADAHERFVEINEAFQMLSDAEKRKHYDAVLVYSSKKKQSSSVTESDLANINAWAEEGRRKGKTYSHSSIMTLQLMY